MTFEKSIQDLQSSKNMGWLQNDITGQNSPSPVWGAGSTSFIYTTEEALNTALTILGNPLRFVGQNPPPR